MQDLTSIARLSGQISTLEQHNASLSATWYEAKPTDMRDVQTLTENCRQSLEHLQRVSEQLDANLRSADSGSIRDQLQYAYNLTKELMQSRQANLELLHLMLGDSQAGTDEYFRAISIKERAAQEQCQKLESALRGLS